MNWLRLGCVIGLVLFVLWVLWIAKPHTYNEASPHTYNEGSKRILVALCGRSELGAWRASHTFANLEWAVLQPLQAQGMQITLYLDLEEDTSECEKRALEDLLHKWPYVIHWVDREDQWKRRKQAVLAAQAGAFDAILIGRLDMFFLKRVPSWCVSAQNESRLREGMCPNIPYEEHAIVMLWRTCDTLFWVPERHYTAFIQDVLDAAPEQFNVEGKLHEANIPVAYILDVSCGSGFISNAKGEAEWGNPLGDMYILVGKTDDDIATLFR